MYVSLPAGNPKLTAFKRYMKLRKQYKTRQVEKRLEDIRAPPPKEISVREMLFDGALIADREGWRSKVVEW